MLTITLLQVEFFTAAAEKTSIIFLLIGLMLALSAVVTILFKANQRKDLQSKKTTEEQHKKHIEILEAQIKLLEAEQTKRESILLGIIKEKTETEEEYKEAVDTYSKYLLESDKINKNVLSEIQKAVSSLVIDSQQKNTLLTEIRLILEKIKT